MDANEHELVLGEQVYEIVGCAMEVLNSLGHGLLEKPYENALVVEFGLRGIPFQQQPRFDVMYKGARVGEYIPDLIVRDQIVVDTKVIERITDHELGQVMNYLRITGLRVGLVLNFRRARLESKRVVLWYSCLLVFIRGSRWLAWLAVVIQVGKTTWMPD